MTAIHLQPSQSDTHKLTRQDAIEALNDATTWVFAAINEWRRRMRERQQLAQLDERMMSDIGISDAERVYLANKPFWEGVMHTAFFRDGDTLTAPEPIATGVGVLAILGRLLEDMVHANSEWLPSPNGELPSEWLNYPPF